MPEYKKYCRACRAAALILAVILLTATGVFAVASVKQEQTDTRALTPLQREIEEQRLRLTSAEIEDRREAVARLAAMHHPAASRVRATAAASVLALPAEESVASLIPLLADKDEFVRQHAAYALGQARSRTAVAALVERLADKKDSVRGAAAVALGQIADAAAVIPLSAILNPQSGLASVKKGQKSKREKNPFVLRAAAHSLGKIGDRAAAPTLIAVLQDERAEDDVRREAAFALGAIGDSSAIPALREALSARDPHLSQTAHEAIRKISRSQKAGGI